MRVKLNYCPNRHLDNAVRRAISGRPYESTKQVVGFPLSTHLPPSQKIVVANDDLGDGCSMVMWLEIRRATTTQRRVQIKSLVRHTGRGLNLDMHTIGEAHDSPWIGARGSNTDTGLVDPGGAPLGYSDRGFGNFVNM